MLNIVKLCLAIACAVSVLPAQNQPGLRRIEGVAPANTHGDLAGFQPVQPIWPNLSAVEANPPDGIKVAVSLTVVDGEPLNVKLLEGVRTIYETRLGCVAALAVSDAGGWNLTRDISSRSQIPGRKILVRCRGSPTARRPRAAA